MDAAESVKNSISLLDNHNLSLKTETPLNCDKNIPHVLKSALIPLFILIMWCEAAIPFVPIISLLMNALPGVTALQAKFSDPIIDDIQW